MAVKPQLLVLQGLPGSGKTTYAKDLVERHGYVRVNKDDLRAMMDNSKHSKNNEKRVIRVRDTVVADALANGKNVVVDDTNFFPQHVIDLQNIASNLDASFKVTFVDTPLEKCLENNRNRTDKKPVPEDAIMNMYNRYLKKEQKAEEDEEDSELPECIIVDIDGTLAHIDPDNSRSHYDANNAHKDLLDDAVSAVVGMAFDHGYQVFIFSGRGINEGEREVTEKWLNDMGVPFDELYMREVNDDQPDERLKSDFYFNHVKRRFKVKFVIDDRPKVCRMWRELGLKTFQVGDPHYEF